MLTAWESSCPDFVLPHSCATPTETNLVVVTYLTARRVASDGLYRRDYVVRMTDESIREFKCMAAPLVQRGQNESRK